MRSWLSVVLCAVGAFGVLTACTNGCDFDEAVTRSGLQQAATYPQAMGSVHSLPIDAWVRNRDVEDFLSSALKASDIGTIAAKYGLQCLPANEAGCADCVTCRRSFRHLIITGMHVPFVWNCVDEGEILIQADIGPGASVRAMTYWKTTRAWRDGVARREQRDAK